MLNFLVATQCLQSAYGVSLQDANAAVLYPLPASLPEIFSAGLDQLVMFFAYILPMLPGFN